MEQKNSQFMSVLAYLGILALIPYFAKPQDEFTAFHTRQGMRLLVAEAITWAASFAAASFYYAIPGLFGLLLALVQFVWLGWLILSILGIVNVVQGKKAPLPILGSL